MGIVNTLLDLFFPPRCAACKKEGDFLCKNCVQQFRITPIKANSTHPSSGEFQFQYALSSDIERIEILRGPQSATWGTDALSAVVNIIRKNQDARSTARLSAESGSFSSAALNFGGTLVSSTNQVWGDVCRLETAGTNISCVGSEGDGSENTSASLGG